MSLNPAEMELLRRGDQQRFNRLARLAAWAMGLLQPMVAAAVNQGIAAAFGEKVQSRPTSWDKLVKSIPHYEDEEREG